MTRRTKTEARKPAASGKTAATKAKTSPAGSKIGVIIDLLARPDGATLEDLAHATGWQAHSVRGALAGSLKKKGYRITSEKRDGVRRYRIEAAE